LELVSENKVEFFKEPMESLSKKPRVNELFVIRAIAFLALVFRHVIGSFIYDGSMNIINASATTFLLALARFGTPTYLFITGFVIFYNYETLKYSTFMKKRFTKVILPYVVWSGVYFVYIEIYMRSALNKRPLLENLKMLIDQTIMGTACYQLWFVIMILQFYILFPFFKKIVSWFRGSNKWPILIGIALVYEYVALWIYNVVLPGFTYSLAEGTVLRQIFTLRDRNFLFWILYFIMGAVFAANFDEIKALVKKHIMIISTGAFFSLVYIIYVSLNTAEKVDGRYIVNYFLSSPLQISLIAYSFFSILVIFFISSKIADKQGKLYDLLKWIGKYAYGGYLVHAIYVGIIANYVKALAAHVPIPLLAMIFLAYIPTFILSFLTTVLISKIKIGKFEVGKRMVGL